MKVLKVLFVAVALIIGNAAFAQFSNTGSNNGNRSSSSNNQNDYSTTGPSYKGFVEGGYTNSDWGYGTIMTSHGIQINRFIFVGFGTGMKLIDGEVFVPIYTDFRVNFLKSKITPFFGTKAGYSIYGSSGGFMFEPSIGCRFGFNDTFALYISTGYELQQATVYYSNYYDYYYAVENVGGFMIRFGFEF